MRKNRQIFLILIICYNNKIFKMGSFIKKKNKLSGAFKNFDIEFQQL